MSNGDSLHNSERLATLVVALAGSAADDDIGTCQIIAAAVYDEFGIDGIIGCAFSFAQIFIRAIGLPPNTEEAENGFFGFKADIMVDGELVSLTEYTGDNPHLRACLAAMRWTVSLANNDTETASAILASIDAYPFEFLYELARLAGGAYQAHEQSTS